MSGDLNFFAIPAHDPKAAQGTLNKQWLAAGNSFLCNSSCKSRARVARRRLEQPRQERAQRAAQRQPAGHAQRQRRLSFCPELNPACGLIPAGTAVPSRTDQTRFSGAAATPPEVQGTRGVGRAAAATRQLPGRPLAWKRDA